MKIKLIESAAILHQQFDLHSKYRKFSNQKQDKPFNWIQWL